MSSNQRYKSHLLNTLQSQFLELQDSLGLRWRQLKHATTWGAQLTIFSLDQILKVGRWGGRVLRQAAAQGAKALSAALDLEPTPETDQPIHEVLAAIASSCRAVTPQEFALTPTTPPQAIKLTSEPFNPQTQPWQIVIQPAPKSKNTWPTKISELWQKWRTKTNPSAPELTSISLTASSPLALQGVASSLTQRHLVLIAPGNQILDILNTEQQQQLQQRIALSLQDVLRWQRKSQFSKYLPIRTIEQRQPVLQQILSVTHSLGKQLSPFPKSVLPERIFNQLRTWVLPQTAALSIRPFQSAITPANGIGSMAFVDLFQQTWNEIKAKLRLTLATVAPPPLIQLNGHPSPTEVPSTLYHRIGRRLRASRSLLGIGIGAIALLPFTLAMPEPAKAAAVPTLPVPTSRPIPTRWVLNPTRSRRQALDEVDLDGQSRKPTQGKIRIAPQKVPTTRAVTNPFQTAIADWANRFSQTTVSEGSPAIEIDAVFAGYDRHPLEQLLLLLDQAMVWIETQIVHWWPIIQTQSVQLWQWWWPVISSAVLYAARKIFTWLRIEGGALWQQWWPVVYSGILSGMNQTASWVKGPGVQLCKQGWRMLQSWLQRAVAN